MSSREGKYILALGYEGDKLGMRRSQVFAPTAGKVYAVVLLFLKNWF